MHIISFKPWMPNCPQQEWNQYIIFVGLEYDYFFQRLIMKVIQIILRYHILYGT